MVSTFVWNPFIRNPYRYCSTKVSIMDRKILIVAAVAVIAILCASFLAMDQLSKPGDDDDDLVIENAGTYTDGTYDDVTIAPSVGDGTVILSGMTIEGDLLINGGGSQSIILQNSSVEGTTTINKSIGAPPVSYPITPQQAELS